MQNGCTRLVRRRGVVTIRADVNYEFPRDFAAFRHAYKQVLLHSLMSGRIVLPVNGVVEKEFLFKAPGVAGFKRHAIWLAPLPLPSLINMTPWQIWHLGAMHVIIGASSIGHTRVRIEPPARSSGDVVGFVLSYVGHQEAVYETWAAAERSGGPYPAAVNLLFCGNPISEGAVANPLTIPTSRMSGKQSEFIEEMKTSCVLRLFNASEFGFK